MEGTPIGRIDKLAGNNTYIAGSNPDIAILLIRDLLRWKFTNTRLLADHYAREVGATVWCFSTQAISFVSPTGFTNIHFCVSMFWEV